MASFPREFQNTKGDEGYKEEQVPELKVVGGHVGRVQVVPFHVAGYPARWLLLFDRV